MTARAAAAILSPVMSGLQHASAFVVQFRMDANLAENKLAGRAEHVATGQTANFESVDDLPELLRAMLREVTLADQSRA